MLQSLFQVTRLCVKYHDQLISAMLCVEFPQASCIDFSEIVHLLKVIAIVISMHLNLSMILVVSHFLSGVGVPLNGG